MTTKITFLKEINDGENKVWVDLTTVLDDFSTAYSAGSVIKSSSLPANTDVTFVKNDIIKDEKYNEYVRNSITPITISTTKSTTQSTTKATTKSTTQSTTKLTTKTTTKLPTNTTTTKGTIYLIRKPLYYLNQ